MIYVQAIKKPLFMFIGKRKEKMMKVNAYFATNSIIAM